MTETKVIISAEDRTAAGIASVKSSMDGLGVTAQAWSGLLKGAFAGLAGALSVDALKGWVKGSIDAADSMNDLSQRIGVSVRDLGTWSLAAAQSGTSMTTVAMGVKSLSGFMAKHSEELQKAGITATDANGAMVQLADLFAAMPDGVEKTALATRLFGRSGAELIPILNGGSAALEAAKQKAAGYATELEKLAPRADEFNDLLAELELQSKATGLVFADHLIGPLTEVVKFFKDAREGADGFHSAMIRLQTLTNSGPASIFGIAADISERGGAAHRAAALAGMGGDEEKRGASGLITGGAGDMARFEEAAERYLQEKVARQKALALLDRAGKGGPAEAGKNNRPFDPFGDFEFKFAEMNEKKKRAGFDEADKAVEKQVADLEKLRKRYVEMADPLQKYRDELDQINTLRVNGKLTADQALEAEWHVGEAMDAAAKKMTGMGEAMNGIGDAAKENSTFARDMGMSFSSAFESAIIGGKNLSDVLQGLAKDIAQIMIRKSITEPMGNALTGAIKGSNIGSSIGGWFNGLFSGSGAGAAVASQGFGMAGLAGELLGFAGGGDHRGGYRIVGERGPELEVTGPSRIFNADQTRNILSGGGKSVVNNYNVDLIDMRGASVEAVARLERLVMSVNASVERRAMGVMGQARMRGAR